MEHASAQRTMHLWKNDMSQTKLVQCRIGAPDTGNSVGLGTAAYSNKFL